MTARAGVEGVTVYRDLVQGTDEWLAARIGMLTASELGLIVTPKTLKAAANDKVRAHAWELIGQRVHGSEGIGFKSFAMERGHEDEAMARFMYSEQKAPVEEVGFITNDEWGFTLGYSPDGLVWNDGLIECKSRAQKYQAEVVTAGVVPDEHLIQVQAAMMISRREWCDYVTYCGGAGMAIIRAYPDKRIQEAIIEAAAAFEKTLAEKQAEYLAAIEAKRRAGLYFETERRKDGEIYAS